MSEDIDMSIYGYMTNDDKETISNCWQLVDRWIKKRQASVRMLEDDYKQTEEVVGMTEKIIRDIYFMNNIKIQLKTLWKRRGGKGNE